MVSCTADGFYCPEMTQKPLRVPPGMRAVRQLARTNDACSPPSVALSFVAVDVQPCGDNSFFCPAMGQRTKVLAGHYTGPLEATVALNRSKQYPCEAGYYCPPTNCRADMLECAALDEEELCQLMLHMSCPPSGIKIKCSDGYSCPKAAVCPRKCKPDTFCLGGSAKRMPQGSYSTPEGNLPAAPCVKATQTRTLPRTGSTPCEPGTVCEQGLRRECGSAAYYCEAGTRHDVADGWYSTPTRANATRRTDQLPCSCGEPRLVQPGESRLKAAVDQGLCSARGFYCMKGERVRLKRGKMWVGAEVRDEQLLDASGLALRADGTVPFEQVFTFRECAVGKMCEDGTEKDCPPLMECQNGIASFCGEGTISIQGQCSLCDDGSFSDRVSNTCIRCPGEGVLCANGQKVYQTSYWSRAGADALYTGAGVAAVNLTQRTQFYRCPIPSACNVSVSTGTVTCDAGHHGTLCAFCIDGTSGWYTDAGDEQRRRGVSEQRWAATGALGFGKCGPCPPEGITSAVTLLFVPFLLALSLAITKKALQPDFSTASCSLIRIFVSYQQMASLLTSINLDYSKSVANLLYTLNVMTTMSGGAGFGPNFLLSCSFGMGFYAQFRFYLVMVGFIAAWPAIVIGFVKLKRDAMRKIFSVDQMPELYDGLRVFGAKPSVFFSTAIMTNFYLIWPALIAQTERMFINVNTADTNGASVCESQGGLPCDSSTHRMFVGLALFVLLVVIPGFPL